MEEMNSTIKRLYDQYKPQDFKYGAAGSDNLNPQREMLMDQIDAIEKKIQDVTDEIVRKKIKTQIQQTLLQLCIMNHLDTDLKKNLMTIFQVEDLPQSFKIL